MRAKHIFTATCAAAAMLAGSAGLAAAAPDPTAQPTSNQYTLTPNPVTPGQTSTSSTFVATSGTTIADFSFDITQPYGTTTTGAFGFSPADKTRFSTATLNLFKGSAADPTSATYIAGETFTPNSPISDESFYASLNAGSYFVQANVQVPNGATEPYTVQVAVKSVSAAPEPSTWLLMVAGVGGLGMALRAQRRQKPSLTLA